MNSAWAPEDKKTRYAGVNPTREPHVILVNCNSEIIATHRNITEARAYRDRLPRYTHVHLYTRVA